MPSDRSLLAWLDQAALVALDRLAPRRLAATVVLVALTLATYLPGVVRLPPVDRTEILYATTSRDMLESGNLVDPRFRGEVLDYKPIGTFWLQMASAVVQGEGARGDITTYRLPSLVGVVLAVLATYWLLYSLIGPRGAFLSAALFAITPILAVQANLAVTEGAALWTAVVGQLALLRLYVRREEQAPTGIALLFWAAQGFGILLNALAVPLVSISTLIALLAFDRNLSWLTRLRPLTGLPIMLLLGSPWLIARAIADGGMPFQSMSWGEVLSALGGSQAMKFKAAPGSFTLALILGFLPGTALLVPALKGLWQDRAQALPRFLLAWLIGYLAYLELISSKPALYTVQALFPAAAAAVALAMAREGSTGRALTWPRPSLVPPWTIPPLFILAVFVTLLWATGTLPSPATAAGALLVAALFALSAKAGRRELPMAWTVLSVGGFAAFLAFTFGLLLPGLRTPWPAPRLASAIAPLSACGAGPIGLLGFREPSADFVLGRDATLANPAMLAEWSASSVRHIAIVENRQHGQLLKELAARNVPPPQRLGCVEAFNVMRGCSLTFSIYAIGPETAGPRCTLSPEFACKTSPPPPGAPQHKSRCD